MANKILLTADGAESEITPEETNGLRVCFIGGDNNIVRLHKGITFKNCLISICGNENVVTINKNCNISNTVFSLRVNADRRNVEIGEQCHIADSIFDVPYSGDKLTMGKNCLVKSKVRFHTQDGHTIFDIETGKAVNRGLGIEIGDNVFIGNRAFIGKNVSVKSNTVILPCANVVKSIDQGNVLVGGNPAVIIRSDIGFIHKEVNHVKPTDNR